MSFKIRFPIAHIAASYSNIKKDYNVNKEVDRDATGSLKQTIIDTDRKSDIKINSIINSTTVINYTSDVVGENKKIKSPYTDHDSKNIFFDKETEKLVELKELDPMFFDIKQDIKYYDDKIKSSSVYDNVSEIKNFKNIEEIFNKLINIEDSNPDILFDDITTRQSYTPSLSNNLKTQEIRPSSPKNTLFTNLSTQSPTDNTSLFSNDNFWPYPYLDKSTDTQPDTFFLNSINDIIYFPTDPVSIQSSSYSIDTSCSVPVSIQSSCAVPVSIQSSCAVPVSIQSSCAEPVSIQSSCAVPVSIQSSCAVPVSIQSSCSDPDSDLIAFMNSTDKDKNNKSKGKDKRKKKRGGKKKK